MWLQFKHVMAAAITAMGIKHTLIGIRIRVLCTYPIAMTPNIVNMMIKSRVPGRRKEPLLLNLKWELQAYNINQLFPWTQNYNIFPTNWIQQYILCIAKEIQKMVIIV